MAGRGIELGKLVSRAFGARRGRKRWILSVPLRGELWTDAGAVRAVRERSKSLFSAGIVRICGEFAAQVSAGP